MILSYPFQFLEQRGSGQADPFHGELRKRLGIDRRILSSLVLGVVGMKFGLLSEEQFGSSLKDAPTPRHVPSSVRRFGR